MSRNLLATLFSRGFDPRAQLDEWSGEAIKRAPARPIGTVRSSQARTRMPRRTRMTTWLRKVDSTITGSFLLVPRNERRTSLIVSQYGTNEGDVIVSIGPPPTTKTIFFVGGETLVQAGFDLNYIDDVMRQSLQFRDKSMPIDDIWIGTFEKLTPPTGPKMQTIVAFEGTAA